MKHFLIFITLNIVFSGCSISNSLIYRGEKEPQVKSKITILDQKSLSFKRKNKVPFSEISDLSYNKKNHKLYMIGDKGNFYVFIAKFGKKIEKLIYEEAYKIQEKKSSHYDSEGLTHNAKEELIISFEGVPRIRKISKKGYLGEEYKLTKKLKNRKNYQGRNKMLEAIAWHPKYGILTASEYPLKKRDNNHQTIYALDGRVWNFQAEKHKNSAITAIEVMDDGNLLILERAYSGLLNPFVITLKKLYLNKCNKRRACQTEVLASYNSSEGWGVNNYEGLTKVGKNRYIMISDNNNKQILKTVLVYFKVNK